MPNKSRSMRGPRKGPHAGEMPKKRVRVRRRRRGGRSNQGSHGREFTSQPRLLGNQINVGKIPLFPPRFRASLRYADTITLSSTSGVVASWVLSANGLFDPDVTGTGHQPAGFDQMMLSYEHYTVLRAKCTATFHNNTASAYPTAALSVNAAATPITTIDQIMEDGLVTTVRLMADGVNGCAQTLQRSINIGVFGGVDDILDDNTYRGTVAANPAEQSYFILQLWNTENATSTSAVDFVLEFDAVFTEPRKLTESLVQSSYRELVAREKAQTEENKRAVEGDEISTSLGRMSIIEGHSVPREPTVCSGRREVTHGICLPTCHDSLVVNADPAVLLCARRSR
jgi:hypothetical protein